MNLSRCKYDSLIQLCVNVGQVEQHNESALSITEGKLEGFASRDLHMFE
jgi:hypothetical protein